MFIFLIYPSQFSLSTIMEEEEPLLDNSSNSNPKPHRITLQRLFTRREGSISRPLPSPAAIVKQQIVYGTAAELNSSSQEEETQVGAQFPRSASLGATQSRAKQAITLNKSLSLSLKRHVAESEEGIIGRAAEDCNSNGAHVVDMEGDPGRRRKRMKRSHSAPPFLIGSSAEMAAAGSERPQLGSASSIVKQAFIGVVIYLFVGVASYIWWQKEFKGEVTYSVVDALYFCIVTLCTIGYGDIVPCTTFTKMFTCAFILAGFGFIDILLSGLVTFVLDKQETVLLSTVDDINRHNLTYTYVVDVEKGRMRIRVKVVLALCVVVGCIGIGTLVVHSLEDLSWVDSFYLAVTSVTTVGYGDYAFGSLEGRLFAVVWLFVSTLAVARAFLYLAELRIDKRNRVIAKWILNKKMTVRDLLAADLDNDGVVSKSEYVIYKLKEMGKVEEKDIVQIVKQFNRLDTDNCGKITLSLLSGH